MHTQISTKNHRHNEDVTRGHSSSGKSKSACIVNKSYNYYGECTITDINENGALIRAENPATIPFIVKLAYDHEKFQRVCKVIERNDQSIVLKFVE